MGLSNKICRCGTEPKKQKIIKIVVSTYIIYLWMPSIRKLTEVKLLEPEVKLLEQNYEIITSTKTYSKKV